MTEFVDRFWSSRDGLKLHFRDYPASDAAAPSRPEPSVVWVWAVNRGGSAPSRAPRSGRWYPRLDSNQQPPH